MGGNGQASSCEPGNKPSIPNTAYQTSHDIESDKQLSVSVVQAIAAAANIPETDIDLYKTINPEALNQLFAPKYDNTPRHNGFISFTVANLNVIVHSNGHIAVYNDD